MSLVRICIRYVWKVTAEERKTLSGIWPTLSTDEPHPICEEKIIDIDDIPNEWADIEELMVKPLKRVKFVSPDPPHLKNFNNAEVREFVKTVNQVVIPGFELLRYGAIQVLENCCTDEIQEQLDGGWRIIAVLPQPNCRRPDYILVKEGK